jgi:hypothetical protein
VKDSEIDEILRRAANAPHDVDPALLERVSASMTASLRPVRPMPPAWMLASALLLLSAAIAVVFAWSIGLEGLHKLTAAEVAAIFTAIGIFAGMAATVAVSEMTPGSKRRINPAMLLLLATVGWIALDAALFHDYQMGSFVPEGIPCLRAGLAAAVPAGMAGWLTLRRGFAVDKASAGLAAGTLAGLAGLAMLEIHCPNLHAMHVMVWHTAVVPVSALGGFLLAKSAARRN